MGWPPPTRADHALRVYIWRLRAMLADIGADDRLATDRGGYSFRVESGELDAERFESLAVDARHCAVGDPVTASRLFEEALSLWRGPALADVARSPIVEIDAVRLDEMRLNVLEERLDAALRSGAHRALLSELARLTSAHPLRERFWGQWIVALYRAGRQAEALRVYRDLR